MGAVEFAGWRHRVLSPAANSETTRLDWQLATVAHQVYMVPFMLFGNKTKVKMLGVEDFLVKFEDGAKAEKVAVPMTPEEATARAMQMFGPLIDALTAGEGPSSAANPAPGA